MKTGESERARGFESHPLRKSNSTNENPGFSQKREAGAVLVAGPVPYLTSTDRVSPSHSTMNPSASEIARTGT